MATDGVPPFPELLSQGLVLVNQGLGFEILEPLMHEIKSIVN
jgi:hypothetical protein